MDRSKACEKIEEVIKQFDFNGILITKIPYGNGHINDTFLLEFEQENGTIEKYILQRINHEVFTRPDKLMENIKGVTSYLKEKIIKEGGDYKRETLCLVLTKDKKSCYQDSGRNFWRTFIFIDNAICYDFPKTLNIFYQSGLVLGRFQGLLSEYDPKKLHETIKDFHNTTIRFESLKRAITDDVFDRVKNVKEEIRFAFQREDMVGVLGDLLAKGELPLRVTHNDTKLNNVMIDTKSEKGLCMIDLDTVMPGLFVNDFGDSIRFGANTAAEDEIDLNKVSCDMELFEIYTKGYLEGCQGRLTKKEIKMLPMGAKVMTFECGIRFLTDYLNGDKYFKIHRENHNLDRCRTQFKLVSDMEEKWNDMNKIVDKYAKLYYDSFIFGQEE